MTKLTPAVFALVLLARRQHSQLRRQLVDQVADQLAGSFPTAVQQCRGHTQPHRQQRNQRQQCGVGQRRGAHRATVPHEALPHQNPEMNELLEGMQLRLVNSGDPAVAQQLVRLGLEFFYLRDRIFGHARPV